MSRASSRLGKQTVRGEWTALERKLPDLLDSDGILDRHQHAGTDLTGLASSQNREATLAYRDHGIGLPTPSASRISD